MWFYGPTSNIVCVSCVYIDGHAFHAHRTYNKLMYTVCQPGMAYAWPELCTAICKHTQHTTKHNAAATQERGSQSHFYVRVRVLPCAMLQWLKACIALETQSATTTTTQLRHTHTHKKIMPRICVQSICIRLRQSRATSERCVDR